MSGAVWSGEVVVAAGLVRVLLSSIIDSFDSEFFSKVCDDLRRRVAGPELVLDELEHELELELTDDVEPVLLFALELFLQVRLTAPAAS